MRLADTRTATEVVLTPVDYEFAEVSGDDWDDNWLVVEGRVVTASASWTFRDPSLLVTEAEALHDWLTRVVDRVEAPMVVAPPALPTLTFVEPNLAFGVVGYAGGAVTIRVFLDQEAAPPQGPAERDTATATVDVTVDLAALADAAAEWRGEIDRFPERR
ncbi:hypothetical protein [Marisediminicola sp. LYQ134]|uniref:WapI family immunity protein n=1 Tax=Marisediminicola sp. LYQ134 TaxID=3391061 RepID=UPI00398397F7